MRTASEQLGCQVMPWRSHRMLCRALPQCTEVTASIYLCRIKPFGINPSLSSSLPFSPASFVADLFLQALWEACSSAPGKLLLFKVILPMEKWYFYSFPQGTFTKTPSVHRIQTTTKICDHEYLFWHCRFWIRLLSICRRGRVLAILPHCQLAISHINIMNTAQFIFVKPC